MLNCPLGRQFAKSAKAQIQSLFNEASQATQQLVQQTHFGARIPNAGGRTLDDDGGDLFGADGDQKTALMRRMESADGNARDKSKPIDHLIAEARTMLNNQVRAVRICVKAHARTHACSQARYTHNHALRVYTHLCSTHCSRMHVCHLHAPPLID